jgi:hypothetical protein
MICPKGQHIEIGAFKLAAVVRAVHYITDIASVRGGRDMIARIFAIEQATALYIHGS